MKRCADTFLIRIGNSAAKFLAVVIFLCFFLPQNYSFKPDVNLIQLHNPGQTVLKQKREEKKTHLNSIGTPQRKSSLIVRSNNLFGDRFFWVKINKIRPRYNLSDQYPCVLMQADLKWFPFKSWDIDSLDVFCQKSDRKYCQALSLVTVFSTPLCACLLVRRFTNRQHFYSCKQILLMF